METYDPYQIHRIVAQRSISGFVLSFCVDAHGSGTQRSTRVK